MNARILRLLAAPALAVSGLALVQPSAEAGMVTFTAATGGSALAGASYSNFDGRTLGSTNQTTASGLSVAFTGGGAFVQGSVTNQYAAPIISGANNLFFEQNSTPGPDTTTYVSTGVGSTTLTFATGSSSYLGLLWGSVDAYNSLTFNFLDGTTQVVGGSAILSAIGANAGGTTAYVNFTGSAFSSVVASSTANSFEFDNVATTAAVPEPSSLALCGIAGAAGLGMARARRRRPTA